MGLALLKNIEPRLMGASSSSELYTIATSGNLMGDDLEEQEDMLSAAFSLRNIGSLSTKMLCKLRAQVSQDGTANHAAGE